MQFSVHFYFSDIPKIQNNLGIGPLKKRHRLLYVLLLFLCGGDSDLRRITDLTLICSGVGERDLCGCLWKRGRFQVGAKRGRFQVGADGRGALCLRMATSTFSNWSAVRRNSAIIFPWISNICFCNSLPANTAWVSSSNA